jgi:hypothetical protein
VVRRRMYLTLRVIAGSAIVLCLLIFQLYELVSLSLETDSVFVLDILGLGHVASLPDFLAEGPLFWHNGFSNSLLEELTFYLSNSAFSLTSVIPGG